MKRNPSRRLLVMLVSGLLIVSGFHSPLDAARIYPSDESSSSDRSSSRRILPSEQAPGESSAPSNRVLPGESGTSTQETPSATTQKKRILPSESTEPNGARTQDGTPGGKNQSDRLLPSTEESLQSESEATAETGRDQKSVSQSPSTQGVRYNPNTASVADLASIPGLSRLLAERIEWYRRQVGPFQDRNDLRKVPGIDRRIYRRISNYFHQGPYR